MLKVVIGKDLIGIHSIVWVWLISYTTRTFTRVSHTISYRDRSSCCNMAEAVERLGRKVRYRLDCKHRNHIWTTITVALLLLEPIVLAWHSLIDLDVERIIGLTLGRRLTSEKFRAEKILVIERVKPESPAPREEVNILKIKRELLKRNIHHLDHQGVWWVHQQSPRIHLVLSI